MEALLIKAIGPSNYADMKFQSAEQWLQIESHETQYFLQKLRTDA